MTYVLKVYRYSEGADEKGRLISAGTLYFHNLHEMYSVSEAIHGVTGYSTREFVRFGQITCGLHELDVIADSLTKVRKQVQGEMKEG